MNATDEKWSCPVCQANGLESRERCNSCQALLSLDNLDALLNNDEANMSLIYSMIDRYESLSSADVDFATHYQLALAYLNIKRIAQGIARLRAAYELQPDQILKDQLDQLVSRYRDLQRKESNEVKLVEVADSGTHKPAVLAENSLPAASEQRIVLIVDDCETVQQVVASTLEYAGYRVVVASHGLEALTRLTEIIPDLILLDIALPHLDGYQLCKLIKANTITKAVPVIMLSGKDGVFEKMRGKLVGATDYVTKPFETDLLIEKVEYYCRNRE
ncbi:MAG TPA: response regulator [Blastocatellia bacterium]|nr:response regulator [Blastocatellia bacterium]